MTATMTIEKILTLQSRKSTLKVGSNCSDNTESFELHDFPISLNLRSWEAGILLFVARSHQVVLAVQSSSLAALYSKTFGSPKICVLLGSDRTFASKAFEPAWTK